MKITLCMCLSDTDRKADQSPTYNKGYQPSIILTNEGSTSTLIRVSIIHLVFKTEIKK